jgi:hypothetical protein
MRRSFATRRAIGRPIISSGTLSASSGEPPRILMRIRR